MIAQEKIAEPIPAAKKIVTTRPDVVRVSFFFMQLSAPAVAEKQRSPGAQDAIAVTVGMQVTVVPACTEHADVDFVLVTMQTSVPVADAADVVVLSVFEVLVVLSVVIVEEGDVVVEEAAADAEDEVESEVVVAAAAVEGSLVVVVSVVFAVVLPIVLASVEDLDSVVSALFFKSSLSFVPVSSLRLRANHTAPTVASGSEQPPVIKHFSISSNRSRSTFAPRHSEIDLEHPQVVLETSSSMWFCAHFVPVAETIAAVANSARRMERIVACETSGIK
jgi:hypothetical protein